MFKSHNFKSITQTLCVAHADCYIQKIARPELTATALARKQPQALLNSAMNAKASYSCQIYHTILLQISNTW